MSRLGRLLACLTLMCAARSSRAAGCETDGASTGGVIDPAYSGDSDGDTTPDASDPCPMATGPTRSPDCYLSAPWVPAAVRASGSTLGSFWAGSGCVPAMAFPVDDTSTGGSRGVVIVGAAADTARWIRAGISETGGWQAAYANPSVPRESAPPVDSALCLVSIDYGRPPSDAVLVSSPTIATFYAHWCPSAACEAQKDDSQPWPPDGLGIASSLRVEQWAVRRPVLSAETDPVERFAFSRGVLYGSALGVNDSPRCGPADAVAVDLEALTEFDPTAGAPRWLHSVRCPDVTLPASPSEPPPDLRLLPPTLDRALRDQSTSGARAVANAPSCLLDGLPNGLLADSRAARVSTAVGIGNVIRPSYLLSTRGLLASTAPDPNAWVVVPETIGMSSQHLALSRPHSADRVVVTSRAPLGAPRYAASADSSGRRLVSQQFAIEPVDATRSVESLESLDFRAPAWPPVADTFDVSSEYGTRWTSNAGSADCWATTGLSSPDEPYQHFAYPLSSGALHELSAAFCPSELNGWLSRTEGLRRDPLSNLCQDVVRALDPDALKTTVADAVSSCAAAAARGSVDAGVAASVAADAVACKRSGCDPLHPETCPANPDCARFLKAITDGHSVDCIADAILLHTETALRPSIHWRDVNDGDALRFISMVGLLRTTGGGAKDVPDGGRGARNGQRLEGAAAIDGGANAPTPTIISEMTNGDDFVGGAHQTLDWNWIVEPHDAHAIDPSYRAIAVRGGRFIGIENELELGIPSGLWNAHVRLEKDHRYNRHGLTDFSYFLASEDNALRLGEIWPTDFCREFGIDRGQDTGEDSHSTVPTERCAPCLSCDPSAQVAAGADPPGCNIGHAYWRTHLGRGLFSPITDRTMMGDGAAESSSMAASPAWPACTAKIPAAPREPPVSLGLEDWQACPHRIAFLGRPIIDCGHSDDACDPGNRLEIHPPHLITMELHRSAIAGDGVTGCGGGSTCELGAPVDGCTAGVVTGVFGWSNVLAGRTMEFDVWPPTRPSPDSRLCTSGDPSTGVPALPPDSSFVPKLGYLIHDRSDELLCGARKNAGAPGLSCSRVPVQNPNHLHCVYDDPGAEGGGDGCGEDASQPEDGWMYGNPRMTPRYATSTFEARFFLGWSSGAAPCPICPGSDGCPE